MACDIKHLVNGKQNEKQDLTAKKSVLRRLSTETFEEPYEVLFITSQVIRDSSRNIYVTA